MTYVNGTSVFASGMLLAFLSISGVIGRFAARRRRQSGFGADDWLCMPALMLTIGCTAVMLYGSRAHVIGYHTTLPTSEQQAIDEESRAIILEKLELVFEMMSVAAIGTIKLVILFCYRRIFAGPAFTIINWTMISVVIAWTVAFTVAPLTACGRHVNYLWGAGPGASMSAAACLNPNDLTVAMAVTDFASDVLVLALPLPWVWRLFMTLRRKLAVTVVFLTGAFATAAGAVRMALAIEQKLFEPGKGGKIFGLPGDIDQLGIVSVFVFWSYVEVGVAMIACCLPPFRAFLDDIPAKRMFSSIWTPTTPSVYHQSAFSSPNPTIKSRASAWSKASVGSRTTMAPRQSGDVELLGGSDV